MKDSDLARKNGISASYEFSGPDGVSVKAAEIRDKKKRFFCSAHSDLSELVRLTCAMHGNHYSVLWETIATIFEQLEKLEGGRAQRQEHAKPAESAPPFVDSYKQASMHADYLIAMISMDGKGNRINGDLLLLGKEDEIKNNLTYLLMQAEKNGLTLDYLTKHDRRPVHP